MTHTGNTAVVAGDEGAESYRRFEHDGWQRAASQYVDSFERVTGPYAETVVDGVRLSRGDRLLDVACGGGVLTGEALSRGFEVVGVDFSEVMLIEARRHHPGATFVQADAEQLPFAGPAFDGVAINFGLLHFPRPRAALYEARRVMRDGGRLASTVWAAPDANRLQGEVFDAVAAVAGRRPALPPPPEGLLSGPQDCERLLQEVGFDDIAVERCDRDLTFRDSDEVLEILLAGTVQTAATLAALDPNQTEALRSELQARLAVDQVTGAVRVTSAAWLATATKPG